MLAAGKYYVGDLCYVLGDKNGFDWGRVLSETGFLGHYAPGTKDRLDPDENTGRFRLKGAKFFSSSTAHGDGCYPDDEGRQYGVDAGLIGCFPMSALGDNPQTDGGHVVEFAAPFDCSVYHGSYGPFT